MAKKKLEKNFPFNDINEEVDFSEYIDDYYNSEIDDEELEQIIKFQSKKKTAPGNNYVTFKLIEEWPTQIKKFFIEEIKKAWNTEKIPQCYREILIKTILKNGKPKEDIDSYRPISLISCELKIINQAIRNRLTEFIEEKNILSDNCYGFRKNMGTQDCLNDIRNKINELNEKYKYVSMIIIDLKKAFDTLSFDMIIKKLCEKKCLSKF